MSKGYTIPEIPYESRSPWHILKVWQLKMMGTDPALIYAFRKTSLPGYYRGYMGHALLSDDERKAWDAAIREFQAANPKHVIARTVDTLE